MTKKEPTVERHIMASNETFEVPVPVDEASVLGFTFEVEDDATVEFSVAFKASGRKKTTQLQGMHGAPHGCHTTAKVTD